MPTKLSRYKQSIFDITLQCFGNLDNLITVSNDNKISISESLSTGTSLVINNDDLGDALIKETILNNNLEFNNNAGIENLLTADTTDYTADDTTITADAIEIPTA